MKRPIVLLWLLAASSALAQENANPKRWAPLSEAAPRLMRLARDYTAKEIVKAQGSLWKRYLDEQSMRLADRALLWKSPETGVEEAGCFFWENRGNPDLCMTVEIRKENALVSFSRMSSSKTIVMRGGRTIFVFPPAMEGVTEEGYFFEIRALPPATLPSP